MSAPLFNMVFFLATIIKLASNLKLVLFIFELKYLLLLKKNGQKLKQRDIEYVLPLRMCPLPARECVGGEPTVYKSQMSLIVGVTQVLEVAPQLTSVQLTLKISRECTF